MRRWRAALAAAVVLALALAAAWVLRSADTEPAAARPPLQPGETYGIDVSSHQGTVDWRRVARDHVSFAYIKATEGGDFTDQRFRANWAGALDAGLPRGAYHFFTLCRPGLEQAAHFLRTVPVDPAALLPALDLELIGNCAARPTPVAVAAEVQAFVTRVEAAWRRQLVLYVGPEWSARYPVSLSRPLWVKSAGRPEPPWAAWQVRELVSVDGVDKPVDLDVARLGALR